MRVPVAVPVISVPVAVGGGAVTGPARSVPPIVTTHGTRIGPTAVAIGGGVRAAAAAAAAVAIAGHGVVIVVKTRGAGAVVGGLKQAETNFNWSDKRGRVKKVNSPSSCP